MLPKVSKIRANGTEQDKIDYLTNYLTQLVNALEKQLSGSQICVKSVERRDNSLIIEYTNGTQKKIPMKE